MRNLGKRHKFIVIPLFVVLIGCSIAIALEIREIVTKLKAGSVSIKLDDSSMDVVNMNGPVEFSHKGRNLKADSGVLYLRRIDAAGERSPNRIVLKGNIEYSDEEDYSGGARGQAEFDFVNEIANLSNSAWVRNIDFYISSDNLKWNQKTRVFSASGKVFHKGRTKTLPFTIVSAQADNQSPKIMRDYTVECNFLEYDDLNSRAKAEGLVKATFDDTKIECNSVNLIFTGDEITGITAEGNIRLMGSGIDGRSDVAIYQKSEGTLVLASLSKQNRVSVIYKGQQLEGAQVIISLGEDREVEILESVINVIPGR